jgi:hypothetical protein
MRILTLLSILFFISCDANKEPVEYIHIKESLSNDIYIKYPKSEYVTHFYDKKDDTIKFDLSKNEFDSIQNLYTKYVNSYPTDTEIYLKNKNFYVTHGGSSEYHFSLKNKNNKVITLIYIGGNDVDKEFENFMKFDTYVQKLLNRKKELKNKPLSNIFVL